MVRDLDLVEHGVEQARRLEVVADGLPRHGGAQLAVDTTLVTALRSDGHARRRAARIDGVALATARRRKERTYPELVELNREVGRWSQETWTFLSQLAKATARGDTPLMRKRSEQAWRLRWSSILACAVAQAVGASLLELAGARCERFWH